MLTNVKAESPAPFFSICIPQYNRTDFLIKECRTFVSQTFRDFEVCIADDLSNDGREGDLLDFLRGSGLAFTYARNERNLRYDANLRAAVALSRGNYLFLMGNDDGLAADDVLAFVADLLRRNAPVAAAITNYRDVDTGRLYRRMNETALVGSGPNVATRAFRRYSFVSGVILDGARSRALATDAVDGSEMYQMYLGTRLVAEGGRLLAIDRVCIDMGLQVAEQAVDSYALWPRIDPCPIVERPLPLGRLLAVVAAGLGEDGSQAQVVRAALQLYLFTYPFWVIEYRKIQSWKYAMGVALALRPSRIAPSTHLNAFGRALLWPMYVTTATAGLLFPIKLFDLLRPTLYQLAKRLRANG